MIMKKVKFSPFRGLIYLILTVYAVLCLYPVIWMGFYSLKDNEEIFITNPFGPPIIPRWENYTQALNQFDIGLYFMNSVYVAIFSMFFGILFALMFTYVVARVKNRKMKSAHAYIMAGMFIPIQAIMTPLVVMVRTLGFTNTLWSLIIPYIALSFPFAVMVLYGFYVSLPMELEESAYMEGAGFYRTYFQIILPQMKSAISVLLIYQFMTNWNEFSLALILITDNDLKTLPLGLAGFYGMFSTEWGPIGAALVIASAPVVILYLFFSNRVSESMALTGLKN